jgi:hypothetical protein
MMKILGLKTYLLFEAILNITGMRCTTTETNNTSIGRGTTIIVLVKGGKAWIAADGKHVKTTDNGKVIGEEVCKIGNFKNVFFGALGNTKTYGPKDEKIFDIHKLTLQFLEDHKEKWGENIESIQEILQAEFSNAIKKVGIDNIKSVLTEDDYKDFAKLIFVDFENQLPTITRVDFKLEKGSLKPYHALVEKTIGNQDMILVYGHNAEVMKAFNSRKYLMNDQHIKEDLVEMIKLEIPGSDGSVGEPISVVCIDRVGYKWETEQPKNCHSKD